MEPISSSLTLASGGFEDVRTLMKLSISELITILRSTFRMSDFDHIEEALVAKETKLNAEIGAVEEKLEIERLDRMNVEEKLKMKNGLDDDENTVIAELKIKNRKLEDEKHRAERAAESWKRKFEELNERVLKLENAEKLFMNGNANVGVVRNTKLECRGGPQASIKVKEEKETNEVDVGGHECGNGRESVNTHLSVGEGTRESPVTPNKDVLGASVIQVGDSQGNNKAKGKEKENYEAWTKEDSDELLLLIVDAIKRGLCDANGSLSKLNVERVILPRLNAKSRSPKTYNHYLSRMKWFKRQYSIMSTLMRNNSGFGWDPITKTVTASDEVWKEYLKSHPSRKNLRGKSMADYEDLKIVVGGGTATGHTSILVDPDDTDAITYREENIDFGMDGFSYDPNNDTFISPVHYEPLYHPPSPRPSNSPPQSPLGSEVPIEKAIGRKRSRSEYGGNSSSAGTNNQTKVLENISVRFETIAVNFEKMSNLMEKKERDREAKANIWDAIKEIPNLDGRTRYVAADLLDTNAKKDLFWKMSIEERSAWINYKLG